MAKKTAAKPAAKAKKGKVRDGKGLIAFFMGQLIQAGHLKTIPKEVRDQHQLAQSLRQMAEKLARQTRKFADDGGVPGAEEPSDDGEEE